MADETEATEPNYTKPPTQEWAEKAADPDYVPSSVKDRGQDKEQSQDGFVNVDPIYANSANEQNLPMQAEGSVEQDLIDEHVHKDADLEAGLTPEGEAPDEEPEEEPPAQQFGQTPQSGQTPPPA